MYPHTPSWIARMIGAFQPTWGTIYQPEDAQPLPTRCDSPPHNVTKASNLWMQDLAPFVNEMLVKAGYPENSITTHLEFFKRVVCVSLGNHPTQSTVPLWKSYMNDDYTPIELSWSWTSSKPFPKVRYVIEPLGDQTGTNLDPYNAKAPDHLIYQLYREQTSIELAWYEHFRDSFNSKALDIPQGSDRPEGSSFFVGLEINDHGDYSVKAYFLPRETPQDRFGAITNAVRLVPGADTFLHTGLDEFSRFLSSFDRTRRPVAEMISIDCAIPTKARIKIYIRTEETSFDSVIHMMTLGRDDLSAEQRDSLRQLWHSIFVPVKSSNETDSLPRKVHPTAGLIYHYDLRLNAPGPKVKLYIPVKHYGLNDAIFAKRFSQWLKYNGKSLRGSTYFEAAEALCKHRRMEDALGFQTYLAASFEGNELSVTCYLQPEMYHGSRKLAGLVTG